MSTKYTLDIIRKQHVVPGTLTAKPLEGVVCEHVGGIFGYVLINPLVDILTVLNHLDPVNEHTRNWFPTSITDENDDDFDQTAQRGDLDVLCLNGEAIGYVIRDNPATIYMITAINGQHSLIEEGGDTGMTYKAFEKTRVAALHDLGS